VPPDLRAEALRLDEGEGNVAEDAYPVGQADQVLLLLSEAAVVVLGGDFYEVSNGRPHPTGMNWYYEGTDAAASVRKARQALGERWVDPNWFVTFDWR
jgi:hypothetical protein